MTVKCALLVSAIGLTLGTLQTKIAYAQAASGDVVVRVDDTSGTHCIDATSEKVTLFLRRVFIEKQKGLFTQDNQAGVLVRTDVAGVNSSPNASDSQANVAVRVPAVDLVSVKDEPKGRVSLALEYGIASDLALEQGSTVTKTINIYMNLAKTKGKSSFGSLLDIAGQALGQLPIPPNPYSQAGSKILKFANDTIDNSIKADNDDQIAHIGLQFNEGPETNLDKCKAAGNERTGAIAVLRSSGPAGLSLIPTTDTDSQYCFRYSSGSTYELLAAKRDGSGNCPAPSTFTGVNNDYVMLLISAQPTSAAQHTKGIKQKTIDQAVKESKARCNSIGLPGSACGIE